MADISELFRSISLPVMPEVDVAIINTLDEADPPIAKIRELIARNLALTAKLLAFANSAAFGQSRRISTLDNGTEFTSKALDEWAYRRGVKLYYTRPGRPTDNGLIESFNGRLRDEFLNVNEFITMYDAREKLRAWQEDCTPAGHTVRSVT